MSNFQTISQSVYDGRSAEALKSQPIRKELPLSSIEVVKEDVLKVDGKFISMSERAFKDLCKIVGLPINFNKQFKENFGDRARGQLINRLKVASAGKNGGTMVSIVVNPESRQIVGIIKNTMDIISNSAFLDTTTTIIDKYGLDVNSFSNGSDGAVIITASSTKNNWGIEGLKNESFFGGISFSNSIKNGFEVSPYLHRLVCANGMIGKSFEETMRLTNLNPKSSEDFFTQLNQMAERGFKPHMFEEKVKLAINTPASLAEMEMAHNTIVNMSGASYQEYKDLESWVPYNATRKSFQDFGIDTILMNQEQRKNARTGTSVYDLVNGITHFASHDNGFKSDDYSKKQAQVRAGQLLSKKAFDVQNMVSSPFSKIENGAKFGTDWNV